MGWKICNGRVSDFGCTVIPGKNREKYVFFSRDQRSCLVSMSWMCRREIRHGSNQNGDIDRKNHGDMVRSLIFSRWGHGSTPVILGTWFKLMNQALQSLAYVKLEPCTIHALQSTDFQFIHSRRLSNLDCQITGRIPLSTLNCRDRNRN